MNEEKSIVSDIAGTTRDAIEDELNIEGFKFRFIDTTGIRNTLDTIENLGIKKSLTKALTIQNYTFLIDTTQLIENQIIELNKIKESHSEKIIVVTNKIDINPNISIEESISISAKNGEGIEKLKDRLIQFVNTTSISDNESIVTNLRHFEELQLTLHEIQSIINGMEGGISGDFHNKYTTTFFI